VGVNPEQIQERTGELFKTPRGIGRLVGRSVRQPGCFRIDLEPFGSKQPERLIEPFLPTELQYCRVLNPLIRKWRVTHVRLQQLRERFAKLMERRTLPTQEDDCQHELDSD